MTDPFLPLVLYAETHFRFRGCSPSLLFRKSPEIIFDLPRRLVPGRGLPLSLLVNDIHQYPIEIESVLIAVSKSGAKPEIFDFDKQSIQKSLLKHPLEKQMSAYLFTIPQLKFVSGEIFVNACLKYRRIKKGRVQKPLITVLNDSLVTSTKLPFRCLVTNEPYPGDGCCSFGDVHCHSQFSRSHVEFGPPIEIIDKMSQASGLEFAAITDHSYDLASSPDNFLHQDKDLKLWEMFKSTITNYSGKTVMVPGEEVSVLNSKNKVVHLGAIGITEYIPGTLDGARKNVYHKKQLSIKEAVEEIERQGGISFAAHPGSQAGILQSIFLKRGTWSENDLCTGLGGIQAVNSGFFESWKRGKKLWISMLQKGFKLPILAGSDAHGDFNRYRAIGKPFLQIHEDAERYMGFVRTGIYGKVRSVNDVIDGIKRGACFLTNGPFVTIRDSRCPQESLISSKPISEISDLHAAALSTKEFGSITGLQVFMGSPGLKEEKVILRQVLEPDTYDISLPIPGEVLTERCYLRIEAYGKTTRELPTIAVSGACFIGY
ncbi:MAG: hypothetical protein LBI42_11680 [Chitinispirillales bacterium]|jgi:hypothetical protein|nr:hypothetical protein [Chitinispirillales bacterium]